MNARAWELEMETHEKITTTKTFEYYSQLCNQV